MIMKTGMIWNERDNRKLLKGRLGDQGEVIELSTTFEIEARANIKRLRSKVYHDNQEQGSINSTNATALPRHRANGYLISPQGWVGH